MRTLHRKLPRNDTVLFVFYGFVTIQDTKISDSATMNVPILVCLQHFCSKCEKIQDINLGLNSVVEGNKRSGKTL